ncbi:AsnC family transcriptional regulator [Bacillus mangrovi]|uniref:AsnC family transcriptional regulator n=1 Tax=Metabacillus mangrovi TaxID=1491830 RepID=A0A7X2S5W5_9BACI|nr:Lrp/AsnC family transcriptional regulator [Metabacillus mangrovi]MTH54258.1 AsnC family transcriptional regulator [Metabacillus mangrovi]
MDALDQKIIYQLQMDARISMTELGQRINLSVPAVKERIRKLEDKGVITGYRAIINPEKIQKHVTAFVLFDSRRCKAFREFCSGYPEVIECHRLAGQYSYLVKVVTESVHNLEDFIDAAMEYGQPSTLINLSSSLEHKPFFGDALSS